MKNLYITWHYTTHGVSFLKNILSQFHLLKKLPESILFENLDQDQLNKEFDLPIKVGFLFDEIIYLTAPQESFDNISSRRFDYKKNILEDSYIKDLGLVDIYTEITENEEICYNLKKEIEFVELNYPNKIEAFNESIWRNIQHYPIEEQLIWLTDYSNFKNVYKGKLTVKNLKIEDLRDEKVISDKLNQFIRERLSKDKESNKFINVSLGTTETQVVWHILAEAGQLPENSRFIKTYDKKNENKNKRFKNFSIKEIPTNLISNIGSGFNLYNETQSPLRELVNRKMSKFLESGFSILLMGERGIGKSNIVTTVNEIGKSQKKVKIVEANCASFGDDNTAEAELFGVEKGTFTGVIERKGLFFEANGGILFLDEIHHLSKLVQAKLMKAIQTDRYNKMHIKKLGSNSEIEVECRLIFATNKNISELRTLLLPDFYDRIVQHVINIPPLRDTKEDRQEDFNNVWKQLKFDENQYPNEPEFFKYIKNLQLYGNYRDLQKIAIYYNTFNQFDPDTKRMINQKTAYQYTKTEFEKYHSPVEQSEKEKYNFDTNKTTKQMIADYLFDLQDWAVTKFGSRKKAIEHFNSRGDTIVDKTFNLWKNKNSLKTKGK
jgi:transcriptional regulator with AAA-type ATPase domain